MLREGTAWVDYPLQDRESCDEVIPGIWIGGYESGLDFPHVRLCLSEAPEAFRGGFLIPIHIPEEGAPVGRGGFLVSRRRLDAAANIIQEHHESGIAVLVHCYSGLERSPLAVAWWLRRYGHARNLSEAYRMIEARRPIIMRRLEWVGPKEQ
jgi:protein-tyrosine phosphatase